MVVTCAGCERPIHDRFLLNVVDRQWHSECLLCHICHVAMKETCFQRDGKLFCKDDFFRCFGTKCSGCELGISPGDLVRKTRDKVFHVKCFTCIVCGRELTTGDQLFMLSDDKVLCKDDFVFSQQQRHTSLQQLFGQQQQQQQQALKQLGQLQPQQAEQMEEEPRLVEPKSISHLPTEKCNDRDSEVTCPNTSAAHGSSSPILPSNASPADDERHLKNGNLPGSPKEVEFGEEAKEESDCESVGSSFSLDSSALSNNNMEKENEQKDGSAGGNANFGSGGGVGAKRRGPRTTIKAKQLETLKSAFTATPKPTRHIREQLARDTGLNMRVIQVWFQNRRSKERRMKQLNVLGSVRRHQFFRSPRRMRNMMMRPGDALDLHAASAAGEHSQELLMAIQHNGMGYYDDVSCGGPEFYRGAYGPGFNPYSNQSPHQQMPDYYCPNPMTSAAVNLRQLIPPDSGPDTSQSSLHQRDTPGSNSPLAYLPTGERFNQSSNSPPSDINLRILSSNSTPANPTHMHQQQQQQQQRIALPFHHPSSHPSQSIATGRGVYFAQPQMTSEAW